VRLLEALIDPPLAAFFGFLLFPALLSAIAIACRLGLPALISVFILLEMTFLLEPFFKGILLSPLSSGSFLRGFV